MGSGGQELGRSAEYENYPMLQTLKAEYAFAMGLTSQAPGSDWSITGSSSGIRAWPGRTLVGVRTTGVYGATARSRRPEIRLRSMARNRPSLIRSRDMPPRPPRADRRQSRRTRLDGLRPGATLYAARSFYVGVGDTSQDFYNNLTQIDNNIMAASYDALRNAGVQVVLGEWQIATTAMP